MPGCYQRIEQQYRNLRGDSTELFREILQASNEIGMEAALAYLGQCAIEKRLARLKANLQWLHLRIPEAMPKFDRLSKVKSFQDSQMDRELLEQARQSVSASL